MPLQKQNVEVSLLPMNQQIPASVGPSGVLGSVRNAMVKKFLAGGSGPRMRIEKRPGMTPLSTDTFSAGAAVSSPADPKILASWKDQLVLVGGTTPYVFSEVNDAWERPSYPFATTPSVAPQTLTRRPLYNGNAKTYAPDAAAVGNVLCDVFSDSSLGALITFVDADGVQIRAPLAPTGTKVAKVVSDGTQFWVFSQSTGNANTFAQVFDTNGAQLATATYAWGAARTIWDAGYQSTNARVFLATSTGGSTTFIRLSYAAGVISDSTTFPVIDSTAGLFRIENTQGGTGYYIGAVNAGNDVTGYQISSSGTISHTYTVTAGVVGYIGNATGFVVNGSFDIRIAFSLLIDNTGFVLSAINNSTLIYNVTFAGVSSFRKSQLSLAVCSRAFVDEDGTWRFVAYYQSTGSALTATGPGAVTITDVSYLGAQPSFFVMEFSAQVPTVVGQFDLGSAYAFYATSRNSAVFTPWFIPSIAADSDGIQHVPLGYLGTQEVFGATNAGPTVPGFAALTGLYDYHVDQRTGESTATGVGLMIPGLQADMFDGTQFTEWGLHLAPEIMGTTFLSGGAATIGEVYTWVFVYEWKDAAGNVYQSAPSEPLTIPVNIYNEFTFSISNLRTTLKTGVSIVGYRTFSPTLTGTSAGTELRRLGSVANSPTANATSFNDRMSDADVSVGQEFYAQILEDNPAIDRFPPPAHSSGINFQDRNMVIGYDGAIWVSGSRVEGEGTWYNPILRIILPSGATPIRLVPMDTRVIVMCAGGELWAFQGANLPNATLTAGALPTPEQVPFTTGARGPAAMTPVGAVYAAERGIWLMDRSITQAFIGAGVLDEVDSTSGPTSIVANDDQRLYFLMEDDEGVSSTILVYDFITGSWWLWDMPAFPKYAAIWQGRFTWVDADTCEVWREDLPETSTYTDDGAAITTVILLESMTFDGASGWTRLWGSEIFGEWKGSHVLAAAFTYDNASAPSETLTMPAGVNPGEYRYEIRQEKQKNIAVAIEFSDSFVWSTLATMQTVSASTMIVDDVTSLRVGSSYSTRTGFGLDAGSFEVVAIIPASKRVEYLASGGWVGVATHEIIHQTDSLAPGNSFTLESVELRIGVKGGLGRLPTQRRMGA